MAFKSATIEKTQARDLLNHFLEKFEALCNSEKAPQASDLEKYLSRDVCFSSNGQSVCCNLSEYIDHIAQFKERNRHVEMRYLMNEPICSENKAVIHYAVNLTDKSGSPLEINIMAIATIEDNKIIDWVQVAHDE